MVIVVPYISGSWHLDRH